MLAIPDPNTFEVLPVGRPEGGRGPGVLRHPQPRRHAVRGRPAPGAAPQPARPPASRASRSTSRPTSSSSTSPRPRRGSRPVPLDEGGFFDLTTTDVAGTLRKQTIRTLETMSIPVEYSFHEDAPSQHEIDLRHTDALTHGRQRHDVPAGGEGGRGQAGRARHVHAQAARGRAGQRACTCTSACSTARTTRSTTDDDPYNLSPVAKQLHRRPAAPRGRDHRGHQPDGEQLQAPGARLRGAGAHQLGPQQPQRPHPGARSPSAATPAPPASSTARPTRRATRTSRSACCSPPA